MAGRDPHSSSGRRIRHRVEAALFQSAVWSAALLPRGAVKGLANVLAGVGWIVCGQDRAVARANLDLAFGDSLSPARKKRIAHEAFAGLSRTMFDLLWASQVDPQKLMSCVEFDEPQLQHIRDLQAAKKGVIFVIPHYGNWELCGLACGLVGIQLTTIAEPGVNPHIDDMMTKARRSTGHRIVAPRNSMLTMVRAAMRSQPVALFIDANARRGRGGIWIDFFGVPVYQSVAAAELAIRSSGSVICCVPKELPDGRVKVDFAAFFDSADATGEDHDSRVRALSTTVLNYYESVIRQAPEGWLWTYKRWKRRPTETRGAFPAYSKYYSAE